mgnify:CR=1 FL=1
MGTFCGIQWVQLGSSFIDTQYKYRRHTYPAAVSGYVSPAAGEEEAIYLEIGYKETGGLVSPINRPDCMPIQ